MSSVPTNKVRLQMGNCSPCRALHPGTVLRNTAAEFFNPLDGRDSTVDALTGGQVGDGSSVFHCIVLIDIVSFSLYHLILIVS